MNKLLKMLFPLILSSVLISCFFPQSDVTSRIFVSPHYLSPLIRLVIYYSYEEMCNTLWQSEDQQIKVQFGHQEKLASLFYKGKEYHLIK